MALSPDYNATEINSLFIVGGAITGLDELRALREAGACAVLSVAAELDDSAGCQALGMEWFHISWQDDGQIKPAADFLSAFRWLVGLRNQYAQAGIPFRVYVHCAAGVNRASLMASFLLASLSGMTGDEAFAMIKAKRPQVGSFNIINYRASCLAALDALCGRSPS